MEPHNDMKDALHFLILTLMFLLFFVLLMPVLIKTLDGRAGKALYAALACGAVFFALRLRSLARRI